MNDLIGSIFTTVNSVYVCLGFTASDDNNILVGNNVDCSCNFNVFINTFPDEDVKYGRIIFDIWWPWFGDHDWFLTIQGMNDQGLFFNAYRNPDRPAVYSGKPFFKRL